MHSSKLSHNAQDNLIDLSHLLFLQGRILPTKPEMNDLRGKARLLKPAMHRWHQIATTENAESRLTTFKKTHLISTEHPFL